MCRETESECLEFLPTPAPAWASCWRSTNQRMRGSAAAGGRRACIGLIAKRAMTQDDVVIPRVEEGLSSGLMLVPEIGIHISPVVATHQGVAHDNSSS